MKFEFNEGEQVKIKGQPGELFIKSKKGNGYILIDEDLFEMNKVYTEKQLTNNRKKNAIQQMIEERNACEKAKKKRDEENVEKLKRFANYNATCFPLKKLFVEGGPELAFYWRENDYEGSILAIYTFDGLFIEFTYRFGTCEVCDWWLSVSSKGLKSEDDKFVDSLIESAKFYTDKNDIEVGEFMHPECKKELIRFKQK